MHLRTHSKSVRKIEIVGTAVTSGLREKQDWLAAIRHACDASQVIISEDAHAYGTLTTCSLFSTRITLVSAETQYSVQVTARDGRLNGAIYVGTPLAGILQIHQDSNEAELLPGQVAMFDSTRPFRLLLGEMSQMVLIRLVHDVVGTHPSRTKSLTACRWEVASGIGAITSNLLTAVGTHLPELDPAGIDSLGSSISGAVMSLIAERLCQSPTHTAGVRHMLTMRIQSWAREHLGDISLTPRSLAQQHNISLRYLQMLFAELGTSPARWIRDERLARCYEDLHNLRYDHLTIAAIGERWALGGASQVSRLFRQQFGCTPSEVRRSRQIAVAS